MIDSLVIRVKAGDGGAGSVSYRRERYVSKGGPDGGDGGRGGDVVLLGDNALDTLEHLRYKRLYKAGSGGPGLGNLKHGRRGPDLVLKVPPGTIAFLDQEPAAEVLEPGERATIARGGKGGRGNKHFATSVHRTPRFAESGTSGEEWEMRLELRLLADAAVVGLPNAGKSTLLGQASAARPRIGDYPFTTLEPQLGVVEVDYDRFALADMPGLIEGAAQGAGLGEEFLQHIQRTSVLIHLLDGSSEDVVSDARQVNAEMEAFDPLLMTRPQLLVVNKIDLDEVRTREQSLKEALKPFKSPIFFISAETGEGVDALMRAAWETIKEARSTVVDAEAEPGYQVFRPLETAGYRVLKQGDRYVLEGPEVPNLVVPRDTTPWEYAGMVRERLRRTRWRGALERAGVSEGDVVQVGPVEIEW